MHRHRRGEAAEEFRTLRERLAHLERVAAGLRADRPSPPGVMLGSVISAATVGSSTTDQYIGVNPTKVTGPVAEGGKPTLAVYNQNVSVLLPGASSVAAGDLLVCRQVERAWIVDGASNTNPSGGGTGTTCTCTTFPGSFNFTSASGGLNQGGPFGLTTFPPATFTWMSTPGSIAGVISEYPTGSLIRMPTEAWFSPEISGDSGLKYYMMLAVHTCTVNISLVVSTPYTGAAAGGLVGTVAPQYYSVYQWFISAGGCDTINAGPTWNYVDYGVVYYNARTGTLVGSGSEVSAPDGSAGGISLE